MKAADLFRPVPLVEIWLECARTGRLGSSESRQKGRRTLIGGMAS
jgi:hypothetical protein